jgi:hypothetical protein
MPYAGIGGGKAYWGDSEDVWVFWESEAPFEGWYMVNEATNEQWTYLQTPPADTDLPPKTGWGSGSLGSDAPTLVYDYEDPTNYYSNVTSFEGSMVANGSFDGTVFSEGEGDFTDVVITFDDSVIGDDPTDEDGDPWIFVPTFNLAPTVGTNSLPDAELTTYADLITNMALLTLLRYPLSFPWANEVRAREVEQTVRRLRSIAKEDPYRKFKRTTIRMARQSFI